MQSLLAQHYYGSESQKNKNIMREHYMHVSHEEDYGMRPFGLK